MESPKPCQPKCTVKTCFPGQRSWFTRGQKRHLQASQVLSSARCAPCTEIVTCMFPHRSVTYHMPSPSVWHFCSHVQCPYSRSCALLGWWCSRIISSLWTGLFDLFVVNLSRGTVPSHLHARCQGHHEEAFPCVRFHVLSPVSTALGTLLSTTFLPEWCINLIRFCTFVFVCLCECVCVCVCVCMCLYVCTCAYMYICTCGSNVLSFQKKELLSVCGCERCPPFSSF